MRGLGISSLIGGPRDVPYYSFDPVNRTSGILSAGNTVFTAVTSSDRYFLLQPSYSGEYVEIVWNGRGLSNHSWGLAPMSSSGPVWNPSWVSHNGFAVDNVPHVIGMKRDATTVTIWRDNGAGTVLTLPSPSAVLHWAMSAANPAVYQVRQPSEFTYSR